MCGVYLIYFKVFNIMRPKNCPQKSKEPLYLYMGAIMVLLTSVQYGSDEIICSKFNIKY